MAFRSWFFRHFIRFWVWNICSKFFVHENVWSSNWNFRMTHMKLNFIIWRLFTFMSNVIDITVFSIVYYFTGIQVYKRILAPRYWPWREIIFVCIAKMVDRYTLAYLCNDIQLQQSSYTNTIKIRWSLCTILYIHFYVVRKMNWMSSMKIVSPHRFQFAWYES